MAAYTNRQITQAYINAKFDKKETAKLLGISHQHIYGLLNTREGLKDMFTEAEEMRIDAAEVVLQDLIINKDFRAVKFFLETKGSKRGFGRKIEVINDENQRKFSSVKMVDGEKIIELK